RKPSDPNMPKVAPPLPSFDDEAATMKRLNQLLERAPDTNVAESAPAPGPAPAPAPAPPAEAHAPPKSEPRAEPAVEKLPPSNPRNAEAAPPAPDVEIAPPPPRRPSGPPPLRKSSGPPPLPSRAEAVASVGTEVPDTAKPALYSGDEVSS